MSERPAQEDRRQGMRDLLANRNYRLLLGAQTVSDLGDGVYAVGLIWAMKELTGSALDMSLVLIASLVPTILFGLFAGVFVDRGSKKFFLVHADLWRGAVMLALALVWTFDLVRPWMLILAAALLAVFSSFFTPARAVAVRSCVHDEVMMQAQSFSRTIQNVIGLVSPALAAYLITVNLSATFYVNAASYLISLLFILFLRGDELTAKQEGKTSVRQVGAGLKEGLRTVWQEPVLRSLMIFMILLNFMFAPIGVLFPLYAVTPADLAVYQTSFFVGLIAGSLVTSFLSKWRKIVLIAGGLLLMLGGFALLSVVDALWIAAGAMFLIGFGSPVTNITLSSLFAVKVPRPVLGRAAGMLNVMAQSAKPASLSLVGSLLLLFDVRQLFLLVAAFGAVLTLGMIVTPSIRKES